MSSSSLCRFVGGFGRRRWKPFLFSYLSPPPPPTFLFNRTRVVFSSILICTPTPFPRPYLLSDTSRKCFLHLLVLGERKSLSPTCFVKFGWFMPAFGGCRCDSMVTSQRRVTRQSIDTRSHYKAIRREWPVLYTSETPFSVIRHLPGVLSKTAASLFHLVVWNTFLSLASNSSTACLLFCVVGRNDRLTTTP